MSVNGTLKRESVVLMFTTAGQRRDWWWARGPRAGPRLNLGGGCRSAAVTGMVGSGLVIALSSSDTRSNCLGIQNSLQERHVCVDRWATPFMVKLAC